MQSGIFLEKKKPSSLATCPHFFFNLLSAEHHLCNEQLKLVVQPSRLRVDRWNLIYYQSGWVSIGKHWRVTNMEPLGKGQEPRASQWPLNSLLWDIECFAFWPGSVWCAAQRYYPQVLDASPSRASSESFIKMLLWSSCWVPDQRLQRDTWKK